MIYALYKIDWTEYERGWGQRPDGTTYYLTLEEAQQHIKEYWDSMPNEVQDCYSSPGKPTLVEVDEKLYDEVHKRKKKKKA